MLGCEDDARCQVNDAVGASAEQVVPDPADGLDAGEDVGEPSEDPGDDEGDEPHLLEALEYLLEVPVLLGEQFEDQVADDGAQRSDILGEEVFEVGLSCLLHHVVAGVIAKQDEEDRGNVVEPLDVPQPFVLREETVQDLQHVPLLLLPELGWTYRWNLVIF